MTDVRRRPVGGAERQMPRAGGLAADDSDTLLHELERLDDDLQHEHDTQQLLAEGEKETALSDVYVESGVEICKQVMMPFFIAGLGMVAAGCLLDHVQHWPVFQRVSEIFILVPALLGLKGNLEMTLASRLSTMANMGKMDTAEQIWRVGASNLALIQAQAAVVALLASMFAVVLAWLPKGQLSVDHALLLCASSTVTAALASFVLGLIMVAVIVQSRRYNWNPDNVATPIAASLGDLVTLAVLAGFGTLFLRLKEADFGYVNGFICVVIVLLLPLWCYLACMDPAAEQVLYTGWTPVIMAMCIKLDSRAARVLLGLTIPGHIAFNIVIHTIAAGHTTIGPVFMTVYLMAAVTQVALLLFTCQYIVHLMWTMHIDPDNSAIPYLTALGDLSGTALLATAFTVLSAAGVAVE